MILLYVRKYNKKMKLSFIKRFKFCSKFVKYSVVAFFVAFIIFFILALVALFTGFLGEFWFMFVLCYVGCFGLFGTAIVSLYEWSDEFYKHEKISD
jgi:FtsH-binding integral membrane protein